VRIRTVRNDAFISNAPELGSKRRARSAVCSRAVWRGDLIA